MRKVGVGVVIAVVLVACIGGAAALTSTVRHHRREARAHRIAATISDLEHFVESARGLKFLHPVSVHLYSDHDFDARDAKEKASPKAFIVMGRTLQALHLPTLTPAVIASSLDGHELGVYSPKTHQVSVRGDSLDPLNRTVIVHELTHALDDQHFNLALLSKHPTAGLHALIEGDARRVENLYVKSLDRNARDARNASIATFRVAAPHLPNDIDEILDFPYDTGSRFVAALAADGGETAVDTAFLNPPRYSSEIIHPAQYQDDSQHEVIVTAEDELRSPPTTGTVVGAAWRGVLGEDFFALALQPALGTTGAANAAASWVADRATVWTDGHHDCIADVLGSDSAAHQRQLDQTLRRWSSANPAVHMTAGPGYRESFSVCG